VSLFAPNELPLGVQALRKLCVLLSSAFLLGAVRTEIFVCSDANDPFTGRDRPPADCKDREIRAFNEDARMKRIIPRVRLTRADASRINQMPASTIGHLGVCADVCESSALGVPFPTAHRPAWGRQRRNVAAI